jgi:hypothetical protein
VLTLNGTSVRSKTVLKTLNPGTHRSTPTTECCPVTMVDLT